MRKDRSTCRGAALPAALAALAVSAALAVAIVDVARTELQITYHRRTAAAALAAADACLTASIASLAPGWDFGPVLSGPDGVSGTMDDGVVASRLGCSASARTAPGPPDPPRMVLGITASTARGRRSLDAIAGRTLPPADPALLWLSEIPPPGSLVGTIELDGADGVDPGAPAWPGVAAPPSAEALDAWMAAEAPHLVSSPMTALPVSTPAPPLDGLEARMRAAAAAGGEALAPAGSPPTLALVAGDLVVPDALGGAGLLFVQGRLDILGTLDFTGLVVAAGGVRVANGGRLSVDGALWVGPATGSEPCLAIGGAVAIRRNRGTIDAADRLLALPRPAALLGLRDLG
jgi:hypothetical protein